MSSKIVEKISEIVEGNPLEETKKVIKKIQEEVETDYKDIKELSDKAKKFVFEQPVLYIKAFIVDSDKKLLVVKTKQEATWDLPTGQIKEGDNPIDSLPLIVKNEVGINVEISRLLGVDHITEKNEERSSISTYLCNPLNVSVVLNPRFIEFKWVHISEAKETLGEPFLKEIDNYERG